MSSAFSPYSSGGAKEKRPVASAESRAMSRPPRYASISHPGPSAPRTPRRRKGKGGGGGAGERESRARWAGRGHVGRGGRARGGRRGARREAVAQPQLGDVAAPSPDAGP